MKKKSRAPGKLEIQRNWRQHREKKETVWDGSTGSGRRSCLHKSQVSPKGVISSPRRNNRSPALAPRRTPQDLSCKHSIGFTLNMTPSAWHAGSGEEIRCCVCNSWDWQNQKPFWGVASCLRQSYSRNLKSQNNFVSESTGSSCHTDWWKTAVRNSLGEGTD